MKTGEEESQQPEEPVLTEKKLEDAAKILTLVSQLQIFKIKDIEGRGEPINRY